MSQSFDWEKAKDGDAEEVKRIVEKYYKVAYKIAHWWARRGFVEESEAISLANIAIMKCIRRGSFDESRGIKFTTYLGAAVHNEIRMFLRKERKKKYATSFSLDQDLPIERSYWRGPDEAVITYGDVLLDDFTLEDTLEDAFLYQDARQTLDESVKVLTHLEFKCMILYLIGTPIRVISDNIGFSQSHARKVIGIAQAKLKSISSNRHSC